MGQRDTVTHNRRTSPYNFTRITYTNRRKSPYNNIIGLIIMMVSVYVMILYKNILEENQKIKQQLKQAIDHPNLTNKGYIFMIVVGINHEFVVMKYGWIDLTISDKYVSVIYDNAGGISRDGLPFKSKGIKYGYGCGDNVWGWPRPGHDRYSNTGIHCYAFVENPEFADVFTIDKSVEIMTYATNFTQNNVNYYCKHQRVYYFFCVFLLVYTTLMSKITRIIYYLL